MFRKGRIGEEFKFDTKIYLTIISKHSGYINLTAVFPNDDTSTNINLKRSIPLTVIKKEIDENGDEIEIEVLRDKKSIEDSFDSRYTIIFYICFRNT